MSYVGYELWRLICGSFGLMGKDACVLFFIFFQAQHEVGNG